MSAAAPILLAALGGAALAAAAAEAVRAAPDPLGYVRSALGALVRAGEQGRAPDEIERRRLGLLSSVALTATTLLVAGLGPALLPAVFGPALAARLIGARRRAYRRRVVVEIPAVASSLADGLAAGGSLRTAIGEAAKLHRGPAGLELARIQADLAAGISPAMALRAFEARVAAEPAAALVRALLVDQRSGGDLARLLRIHAAAGAARQRAEARARSATAQARLSAGMVAVMPFAAILLIELAAPGFVASLLRDPTAATLLALAAGIQVGAYALIRRLGETPR